MQSAESEVDTTLSEQDKCEIRKSYRNALAPRQHVKILMELYLASREEIEEALGFTHKEARRPIRRHTDAGRPNTYAKHPIEVKRRIVGLVLSGMTYEEAGAMYDVSKNTVANWVMKYRRGELSPIMLKEEKADAKL
ncbi:MULTISPECIES: helix-turn-helix domain-containing protein [Ruthenibacterium]|uniref:Helix-turn-helix domain-containing protein n=1 Tax=Ruthenibacterium lactatiformans TaxID=1550024 RepID=A0A6I2U7T2_9FIRM|nr:MULTISPECIES: helix-turn-helix domain-containing protein [Ruthenibacterium]MBQ1359575.1 helix-turn-helix domain-containing protein [Ruthenibacterium sp.]MST93066.1 helix-turn-helix domain-containing protein [Ruthenibacterium lactatiformans]RJW81145.1 helix-turn-helix domain-containing protein [Subdoligranulum sp. OF01-18]